MSEKVTTLGSLLIPDDAPAAKLLAAAGADEAFAGAARHAVEALLPDLAPRLLASVREVLDVPVPGILAGAWGRSVELLKYRDPERYPPEKVSLVPLAPHTVTSRHRPVVEVEVSGMLPAPVTLRLALDVRLTAKVEGAKIEIRAGRIRKLLGGTIHLAGTLSAGDQEIGSGERLVTIPGELSLGDGIAIAPAIPLGGDVQIAGAAPPPAAEPHSPAPTG